MDKRISKEQVLNEVGKAINEVEYGKIILVINGSTDFVDIIIEKRQRIKSIEKQKQ